MKVRSIAAGAGTGKTTELTRIIRESIVSGDCRPYAVIGTTFTNKAAGELIERVRQELFKTRRIDLAERCNRADYACLRFESKYQSSRYRRHARSLPRAFRHAFQ